MHQLDSAHYGSREIPPLPKFRGEFCFGKIDHKIDRADSGSQRLSFEAREGVFSLQLDFLDKPGTLAQTSLFRLSSNIIALQIYNNDSSVNHYLLELHTPFDSEIAQALANESLRPQALDLMLSDPNHPIISQAQQIANNQARESHFVIPSRWDPSHYLLRSPEESDASFQSRVEAIPDPIALRDQFISLPRNLHDCIVLNEALIRPRNLILFCTYFSSASPDNKYLIASWAAFTESKIGFCNFINAFSVCQFGIEKGDGIVECLGKGWTDNVERISCLDDVQNEALGPSSELAMQRLAIEFNSPEAYRLLRQFCLSIDRNLLRSKVLMAQIDMLSDPCSSSKSADSIFFDLLFEVLGANASSSPLTVLDDMEESEMAQILSDASRLQNESLGEGSELDFSGSFIAVIIRAMVFFYALKQLPKSKTSSN